MKTILITGARAPASLDLARGLAGIGYRVIAAESALYPLSLHSNAFSKFYRITAPNHSVKKTEQDLLTIIEKENVDILIPTCEEIFHLAQMIESLSQKTTVLVDSFENLACLHSKFEFNELIRKKGFRAPLSLRVHDESEMKDAIKRMPGDRVVLKPEFSRFATQTLILSKQEASMQVSKILDGRPWVVQECLNGTEYCTYSFARNGKLVAHVTYDHEFTAGKGAGICFSSVDHAAIEAWIREFVQKMNFTGQIAFDFIEDEQGAVQPIECNPRATSGLHLLARQPDFLKSLTGDADFEHVIHPPRNERGQLRLAMLSYGVSSIRSVGRAWRWINVFFTSREVVFSWRDPMPFFDQFVSFYQLIRESKKKKITALEASTQDIEWNGGLS